MLERGLFHTGQASEEEMSNGITGWTHNPKSAHGVCERDVRSVTARVVCGKSMSIKKEDLDYGRREFGLSPLEFTSELVR